MTSPRGNGPRTIRAKNRTLILAVVPVLEVVTLHQVSAATGFSERICREHLTALARQSKIRILSKQGTRQIQHMGLTAYYQRVPQ
jgi:hypothetical protein